MSNQNSSRLVITICLVASLAFSGYLFFCYGLLRIHASQSLHQVAVFNEMYLKCIEAPKAPYEKCLEYLRYAHGFYPSGTWQSKGHIHDLLVEDSRGFYEEKIIEILRQKSGKDLGDNAEDWLVEFDDGRESKSLDKKPPLPSPEEMRRERFKDVFKH
jgi:hypothetical protein